MKVKLTDEWQTPHDFREWFETMFGYPEIDVACNGNNMFGDLGLSDGLLLDWNPNDSVRGIIWCNPPYSQTSVLVDRAIKQFNKHKKSRIYMLLKNDTSTKWFNKLMEANASVWFLNPRIQFDPPEGLKKSSNAFSSILVLLDGRGRMYYNKWK